ncbi:MAG: S8 family serine peptidase [Hyphomicrobiaceae bacterium]|nr:S8 family serine peptidase [Hyphomicrobiaceae bacterium]
MLRIAPLPGAMLVVAALMMAFATGARAQSISFGNGKIVISPGGLPGVALPKGTRQPGRNLTRPANPSAPRPNGIQPRGTIKPGRIVPKIVAPLVTDLPAANSRGSRTRAPARTAPEKHPPLICINGSAAGRTCVCDNGRIIPAVGQRVVRCPVPSRPQPCPAGEVRSGGSCVDRDPPRLRGAAGTCLYGRWRQGVCVCPGGRPAQRLGRSNYVCRPDLTCDEGWQRVGSRCTRVDRPSFLPPIVNPGILDDDTDLPACARGYRLRGERCVRVSTDPACGPGTLSFEGRCLKWAHGGGRALPPSNDQPPLPSRAPTPTAGNPDFEPDEVLVEISGTNPRATAERLESRYRLNRLSETRIDLLGASLLRFAITDGRPVATVAADLATEPGVTGAQPNRRFRLNKKTTKGEPEDKVAPEPLALAVEQYALDLITARTAHTTSRGADIKIAVIDSGIDADHPELAGAIAASLNTFTDTPHAADAHGTGIAGIIAARRELTGIAPDAKVLAVEAFSAAGGAAGGGRGTSYRIATGVDWALANGAKVVNMSFEGGEDDLIARVLAAAARRGALLVAAAGNGGKSAPPAFPASHPDVLAVTATDDGARRFEGANVGDYLDVAAPGVSIIVAAPDAAYDLMDGTSFAAAHVSGVAALVLAVNPDISREELSALLARTARDLGNPGRDELFGAGLIDAARAVSPPSAAAADAPARVGSGR